MQVTGEQLKQAMIDKGIDHVNHHQCSFCQEWVFYTRQGEHLFFESSCGCASSEPRPYDWDTAARWVNMQSSDETRRQLAARFGVNDAEVGQ